MAMVALESSTLAFTANDIKQMNNHWRTRNGRFHDIIGYHSNNTTC